MPHDQTPTNWETLPASITLAPGEVMICLTRLEVLAAELVALASLLDQHLEEFAARYEPCHNLPDPEDSESLQAMFSELEAAEAERSAIADPAESLLQLDHLLDLHLEEFHNR